MSELRTLLNGIVFGEQPRWHKDRLLWFADWGTQDVIAVDLDGNSETVLHGLRFRCASTGSRMGVCCSSRRAMGCSCAASATARSSPTPT